MSLKVHMLLAHYDKFEKKVAAYLEEQAKGFHQDVMDFERHYRGQYNQNMSGG